MKNIITILFIAIFSTVVVAQSHFRYNQVKVINEVGDTIKNPFAGGFNAPQFSEIDLNFDGIKDLFVFDRDGGIIKTFINGGTVDSVDYTYTEKYWESFPELRNFALLRDYNCDGKEDVFTGAVGGVAVYKNISTPTNGLQFELVTTLLMSDYGSTSLLNLYVPSTDIPAITDIDNDGDLDVLTFGVWGTTVEYHQNLSMDLYNSCDSLVYVASTTCWGNFSENSQNNNVTLGTVCKGIVPSNLDSITSSLHSGSTLLAIDLDADGDKELMLGDISFSNLVALTNGGDSSIANIIAQTNSFPAITPVDIQVFPAAYYLDINNDGIKDMLVATNTANVSVNFKTVWYYKNTGTDNAPVFNYIQDDFLQNEMIEVGGGANAVFEDVNQDGLLDLIIGNYGYYGNPNFTSGIAYFENVGTQTTPMFKLISRDYGGFSAIGVNGLFPAFGDVDADGDNDLVLGNYNGDLYLYENIAGAGNVYGFNLLSANYMGIDVGQFSAPQLVDYNNDGLLDLLIGERSGNINYFENKGTPTTANFTSQATTTQFGQIDVMIPCCTGFSTVHLTTNDVNEPTLYVGAENGIIYIYSNIDTITPSAPFTLTDSIITGAKSVSIFTADINNSGKKEELYAENSGGISILHLNANLQLVYPNNGDVNVPYDVTLDWNAAPMSVSFYEYNIDTVNTFNSPVLTTGQNTYLSSSSIGVDSEQLVALQLGQQYFWKVRYLTAIDTSVWSDTWSFTVTSDSVTIADFIADSTLVVPYTTVNFTDLSSSNPTSWLWTFTNGTPNTSTAQNPQVVYDSIGIFDVQLISTNIFGIDTILKQGYITVTINNSITERGITASVLIYPNPTKGSVTIERNRVELNSKIEVVDVNGKIYLSTSFQREKQQLSTQKLSTGIYFIRIIDSDKISYHKFVKY